MVIVPSESPLWYEGWSAHEAGQPLPEDESEAFKNGWRAREEQFPHPAE